MRTLNYFLTAIVVLISLVSCSSDDDSKMELPLVYNIKAYTSEVDTSENPMGSTFTERITKGTITITENTITYNFNPKTNGGVGTLTADYSDSVTKVDSKANKIYYGIDKGFVIYEYKLKDGRKVLIDECPVDNCYMYWVIE